MSTQVNKDPLFVVNPKSVCIHCGADRRKRRICKVCKGTGGTPVDLNGLWGPSPGFLVCGGPSLNDIPKERLRERGIISLAVNNSAGHMPVSAWVFGDPQNKFHHGIHLDPKCLTFAPNGKLRKKINVKNQDGKFRATDIRVMDCPGVMGFSRSSVFNKDTFLTDVSAHWGPGGKQSEGKIKILDTMFLGLRLMHYLGCPRVYMLGVDFNMTSDRPYAFGQEKGGRNGRYKKTNSLLKELRPVFEKAGFFVYNCNPKSKCDAFDYVSFEKAYLDCKGGIPPEPFDLSQWYEKTIAESQIQENRAIMSYEDVHNCFLKKQ
jgi:hypothetical protein